MENLKSLSYELRKDTVDIIMAGKGGHIGGDMSCMDILIELYFEQMNISPENQDDPDRDRFIMSKGHSVESLYAVLAKKGFFSVEEVKEKFSKFGSQFIGHPNNKLPGIEMNSGSLGHGLPVAVGMALAGRMDKKSYRVYTLMGDGELAEGSVWEGFMSGGHYKLDNLCAIIDLNGLQISGTTDVVMNHKEIVKQVESFGWNVIEAQGHDFASLKKAFEDAKAVKGQPSCVIAHTIKGFGAKIMENKAGWHHHLPTDEEYAEIIKELAERKESAEKEAAR
ncbi:MAG: transketolase [Lachnospiraceae bacterium]|nr:transketolase [Lachnospiraceae bacterium]